MKNNKKKKMISFGFMLPVAIIVFSLVIYPIVQMFILSFQNVRFLGATAHNIHFTLENYYKLVHSPSFWSTLNITGIYVLATTLIAFVIGLATALLLNQKFKGNHIARIAFLLAWPIPGVVVSWIFIWMFDPSFGVINYILRSLRIISTNLAWLSSPNTALAATISATVWKAYPFFTLMLYAGLQGIPEELYEAASVDGATAIDKFKCITLPGLRSVITISVLLSALWVFRTFDIIFLMTGGGPFGSTEILPVKLYQEAFSYFHMSYAATMGVITFVICAIVIAASTPILKKEFY